MKLKKQKWWNYNINPITGWFEKYVSKTSNSAAVPTLKINGGESVKKKIQF